MKQWLCRILVAVLAMNAAWDLAMVAMATPPTMCLNGIMMTPQAGHALWVQKGMWPQHCLPVDRN